jgi:hypothetical protein
MSYKASGTDDPWGLEPHYITDSLLLLTQQGKPRDANIGLQGSGLGLRKTPVETIPQGTLLFV